MLEKFIFVDIVSKETEASRLGTERHRAWVCRGWLGWGTKDRVVHQVRRRLGVFCQLRQIQCCSAQVR